MAITTYQELQDAVANWRNQAGDAVLTARAPEFIALAEADINRRLRVREQETATDLTVNAQAVALPTGFIGVRRLYLSASPLIVPAYLAPEKFWETYTTATTDRPRHYTIEGDNLVFGPSPAETYTGKLLYWKRLDVSSTAHALFTRNPDLYLFGALVAAEPYFANDERMAFWKAQYEQHLANVAKMDKRDRFPSGVNTKPSGPTP